MDAVQTTTSASTTPAAAPAVTDPAVKPGYQTTEFWMTAGATVVGLAIASGVIPTTGYWPSIVALIVSAFAAMGYTVSRTVVKNG
jgi:hypothetical protein